jgi:hypothetical protein
MLNVLAREPHVLVRKPARDLQRFSLSFRNPDISSAKML